LDAEEPHAIPGTQEANQPFFSPDGRWIGFFADGKLQKVAVAGGAPILITAALSRPSGASWGDDGTILYHLEDKGLFRVNDGGGAPTRIEAAGDQGVWPHFLPDSRHALVTIGDSIAVLTLATGELRKILSGSQARDVPTGHLLYAANVGREVLQLVPFDFEGLRVTGAPLPALENVFRGEAGSALSFAVSRSGVLVYVVGGSRRSLVWVNPTTGREEVLPVEPMGYRFPDLSPDGRYLAVTVDPRPSDIWVLDLERPGDARRISTPGHEVGSTWSRDGRGFLTSGGGLFWVPWPAGEPRRIDDRSLPQLHPAWMADGRVMAFEPSPESGDDLVLLDPAARTSDYFLRTSGNERMPSASPDGKWVAFASDQTGTFEVYVVSYPVPGEQHRVSTGGGIDPRWMSNGNIYYQNGTTIMAAAVQTAPRFSVVGAPREITDRASGFTGWWDVAPDGRLLLVHGDRRTTRQFQVVFNWFEEIRAKTAGR
jgi:serine/threonine-protein kinase